MSKVVFEYNHSTYSFTERVTQGLFQVQVSKGHGTRIEDKLAVIEFWHADNKIWLQAFNHSVVPELNEGVFLDEAFYDKLRYEYKFQDSLLNWVFKMDYSGSAWLPVALAKWLITLVNETQRWTRIE